MSPLDVGADRLSCSVCRLGRRSWQFQQSCSVLQILSEKKSLYADLLLRDGDFRLICNAVKNFYGMFLRFAACFLHSSVLYGRIFFFLHETSSSNFLTFLFGERVDIPHGVSNNTCRAPSMHFECDYFFCFMFYLLSSD